jgi:hypothetical protein
MTMKHPTSRTARSGLVLGLALTLAATTATTTATATEASRRPASSDAVLAWNTTAGEAALAACIAPVDNPLTESRAYAMMHLAIHDALNAIVRRSQPYAYSGPMAPGASPDAAVAAAARDVLIPTLGSIPASCGVVPSASTLVEDRYTAALGAIADGPAKDAGIGVGQASAAAILAKRSADGSTTPLVVADYVQGTTPGAWRFTPDRPFAFAPGWGEVMPFALTSGAQYRPGPPPALTSRRYTKDYLEVKRLGGDDVTTASERTDDQTQIALSWLESSPLRWNRIARTVVTGRHLDLWEDARLFGLLNIALADGYIGSFSTKYHYAFWRPVTAIREAGTDGNPATGPDPAWTPLVTTPPIPDYESAHAVEGAAAVAVLQGVLKTDRITFDTCSYTLPPGSTCTDPQPVLRHFTRLSKAAQENAESRIFIGFHFRTAVETGLRVGDAIGDRAVDTALRRVR